MVATRKKLAAATGFTLIEVLVVLAVIGLLATLIFPAFMRVREAGRAASCTSNLKQIALALSLYTDDFSGSYPVAGSTVEWDQTDPQTGNVSWMQQVFPYVKSPAVYRCPSDGASGYSYFLSTRVAYVETGGFAPVSEIRIQYPSAFVIMGDTFSVSPGGFDARDADKDDYTQNCVGGEANGTPALEWRRHNGGQNIAFAAGHVKRFTAFNPQLMTFRYNEMRGWQ